MLLYSEREAGIMFFEDLQNKATKLWEDFKKKIKNMKREHLIAIILVFVFILFAFTIFLLSVSNNADTVENDKTKLEQEGITLVGYDKPIIPGLPKSYPQEIIKQGTSYTYQHGIPPQGAQLITVLTKPSGNQVPVYGYNGNYYVPPVQKPANKPTTQPTSVPTIQPTNQPSISPTSGPTVTITPTPGPQSLCGDGTCGSFENCINCELDCGSCASPTPGLSCGDGTCGTFENCINCVDDCGSCPDMCPDGHCTGTESCYTCEQDCGSCNEPEPEECTDGVCEGEENCLNCPADCGCAAFEECDNSAECVSLQATVLPTATAKPFIGVPTIQTSPTATEVAPGPLPTNYCPNEDDPSAWGGVNSFFDIENFYVLLNCGDGVCESPRENCATCEQDCGCSVLEYCEDCVCTSTPPQYNWDNLGNEAVEDDVGGNLPTSTPMATKQPLF